MQIPDKVLEHRPRDKNTERNGELPSSSTSTTSPQSESRPTEEDDDDDDSESGNYIIHDADAGNKGQLQNGRPRPVPRPRRMSMYEDGDAVMDPESVGNGVSRSSSSRITRRPTRD